MSNIVLQYMVSPQDREVRKTYLLLRCWLRARIPQIVYQPKTPLTQTIPGIHCGEFLTTHTQTQQQGLKI